MRSRRSLTRSTTRAGVRHGDRERAYCALGAALDGGVASATTTATGNTASATSHVANATVLSTTLNLNAQVATASASYTCKAGVPTPQSASNVVGLTIGSGAPITTSGRVSLPVGGLADIELNRTITTAASVTQRAVDITVLSGLYGGVEIVLGEASAGISGNPCAGAQQSGPPTNTSPPVISSNPSGGQPVISGTASAGETLSCSTGAWTGNPTRYTYQWSRDGTPIVGATNSTYTVKTGDEATTLTCTVTAYNTVGASAPATSPGVGVRVPHVPRCPAPSGQLTGETLGLARLGMTRAQAHRAFTHSSNRGRRYQDFFCLTPTGVRVGYASDTLMKSLQPSLRRAYQNRVVVVLTSAAYYSLHGIRPGATLAAARMVLGKGNLLHIGLNYWYFAQTGKTTSILKVRHGIVEEIGIADPRLTHGHKAQLRFITSFWT